MVPPDGLASVLLGQFLLRILPNRLEHRVARLLLTLLPNQALVYQTGDPVQEIQITI